MKKSFTSDSIGKWIIKQRPFEDTLNILLMPLWTEVLINLGLIAACIDDFGDIGHIVAVIIYICMMICVNYIYYEYYYDNNSFFLASMFKWLLATILSLIPNLLIFGSITLFIAANLLSINNNGHSHPNNSTVTLVAFCLATVLTVLSSYSFRGFKSDKPKTVFYSALFVAITFIINIILFLIYLIIR